MNVKKQDNQKRVADSNIRNDNSLYQAHQIEQRAIALQNRGLFKQAIEELLLAFRIYRRRSDRPGLIETSHRLGDLYRQIENFQNASEHYQLAQKFLPKNYKSSKYIDIQLGQALSLRGRGLYKECVLKLKNCLSAYLKSKDLEGQAYAHWAIGSTQRFAGQLPSAELHLRKSVTLYRRRKDRSGLAYAQCALGGTLRMKGSYHESGRLYRQAFNYFQRASDTFGKAYSCCGQGNALRMQGHPKSGLPLMNKAISLYQRLGQKGPQAFVCWSKAQAEMTLGKYKNSERLLRKSRILFQKVHDLRGLVYTQLGFAELARFRREKSTKSMFLSTLKMAQKYNLPLEARHARQRLGNLWGNHKPLP